jgi:hypothetical protein
MTHPALYDRVCAVTGRQQDTCIYMHTCLLNRGRGACEEVYATQFCVPYSRAPGSDPSWSPGQGGQRTSSACRRQHIQQQQQQRQCSGHQLQLVALPGWPLSFHCSPAGGVGQGATPAAQGRREGGGSWACHF